jgi:hypothetical protein
MGSTKSSESKSASGSGQQWATPFAQAAAGQVANVYNQNQPNLQATTDLQRQQVVDPLISEFNSTLPTSTAASGYYGDVLNGKYLNGNPYLGQVTDQLNRNVADQVNSQFEGAGRYGSDSYAQTLARETGAADANLSYNNYQNGLNQMGQAAQGATTQNIGTEQALASAVGQNAALPYVGSQAYAGSLGQLMNGGTSSGVTYQPNPIFGAIGAGLGAAGQIFSDIRLKTNVTKVGEFDDGLGIYTFAYKADPKQMFKGVMAHEVKKLRPWAYVENYRGSGFDGVNYGAL